jgi:hypothetical protein
MGDINKNNIGNNRFMAQLQYVSNPPRANVHGVDVIGTRLGLFLSPNPHAYAPKFTLRTRRGLEPTLSSSLGRMLQTIVTERDTSGRSIETQVKERCVLKVHDSQPVFRGGSDLVHRLP